MTGACRFCGQIAAAPDGLAAEQADYYATYNCDCSEGIGFRKCEEQINGAKLRVDELFGEDCTEYGFDTALPKSIIDKLKGLCEELGRGSALSFKASFPGQGSASLSITSKGKIKVQRSIGHAFALEE